MQHAEHVLDELGHKASRIKDLEGQVKNLEAFKAGASAFLQQLDGLHAAVAVEPDAPPPGGQTVPFAVALIRKLREERDEYREKFIRGDVTSVGLTFAPRPPGLEEAMRNAAEISGRAPAADHHGNGVAG